MQQTARPTTPLTGPRAEKIACDYLQRRGLTLVERNYRCRRGEIDLIMREGKTLVFIEVRYRRSDRYGSPAESVNDAKQARIVVTAQHYLAGLGYTPPCRFDVLALTPSNTSRPDWIRNAFGAA